MAITKESNSLQYSTDENKPTDRQTLGMDGPLTSLEIREEEVDFPKLQTQQTQTLNDPVVQSEPNHQCRR